MIKRALLNKGMLLAVGISIVILYYELFVGQVFYLFLQDPGKRGNDLTLMATVYALSVYVIFAGMFPGIPYGFSLLEERNSGYMRFILQRMPAKKYICSKILATGISGAVSTLIPYLALIIPIRLVMAHSVEDAFSGMQEDLIWREIAVNYGAGAVYFLRGVLLVLFGILWAEVTLLLSLFVKNKYIAFVLPFVLFELIWILFPFRDINPVFMIRSDLTADESLIFPCAVFLLYIVSVIVGIYFVFRRQFRNEKF